MSALAFMPEARSGAVAVTKPFDGREVGRVASSPEYSLHAGLFTSVAHAARQAADGLQAGVRPADAEMTQTQVVCIRKAWR